MSYLDLYLYASNLIFSDVDYTKAYTLKGYVCTPYEGDELLKNCTFYLWDVSINDVIIDIIHRHIDRICIYKATDPDTIV